MNQSVFIAAALITGALLPIQLAFNAQLGGVMKNPFTAGLVVFLVGTAALGAIVIALRPAIPPVGEILAAPKTIWLGGLIATLYIIMVVIVTPKIGVGATAAFIVAGQLIAAVALDHFGAFGAPQISLNLARVAGKEGKRE